MDSYKRKRYFKIILLLIAIVIGVFTLYFSQKIANKLAIEEKKKIALWAEAIRTTVNADLNENSDLTFPHIVIESNTTIPAILVDENNKIIDSRNFDSTLIKDKKYLEKKLLEFQADKNFIKVPLDQNTNQYVYYGESTVLSQLRIFPYIMLGVVGLFIAVSYFAFSYSRKAEQNQVWVGLAKETAHQLGTPISSLMGWIEYLELELGNLPNDAGNEMRKDIERLNIITERFSKIGSHGDLIPMDINETLENAVYYMSPRISKKIKIEIIKEDQGALVALNKNLFGWVIENITKNSVDAMQGEGTIIYKIRHRNKKIILDITDNGKGLPRNLFKTIFKPGFTTKKRGWGLGLSLTHRIIHDYHKGEIFLKESIPFQQTTMRIVLNEFVKK